MKCIHVDTGQVGIIMTETDTMYGVYWTFKYNRTIPNHFYWNKKEKIKIHE